MAFGLSQGVVQLLGFVPFAGLDPSAMEYYPYLSGELRS